MRKKLTELSPEEIDATKARLLMPTSRGPTRTSATKVENPRRFSGGSLELL
jgi:hypothetical protein